jgi:hypothetical protein
MIFKTVVFQRNKSIIILGVAIFQRNKTEMIFRFQKIGRELGLEMIFGFLNSITNSKLRKRFLIRNPALKSGQGW